MPNLRCQRTMTAVTAKAGARNQCCGLWQHFSYSICYLPRAAGPYAFSICCYEGNAECLRLPPADDRAMPEQSWKAMRSWAGSGAFCRHAISDRESILSAVAAFNSALSTLSCELRHMGAQSTQTASRPDTRIFRRSAASAECRSSTRARQSLLTNLYVATCSCFFSLNPASLAVQLARLRFAPVSPRSALARCPRRLVGA